MAPYRSLGNSHPFRPGRRQQARRTAMKKIDELQKLGKDGVEVGVQALTLAGKGAQAIASEYADYARKSFEQGSAAFEQLIGARSLERAIEVQSDYAKSAYEGFVAQATKLAALYVDVAKETYKPIEGYTAKMTPVV
jgi:hypothetical protein